MKNKNVFKINLIYFVALVLVATIFLLGYTGVLRNDILTSFLIQVVVMFGIPLLLYSLLIKKHPKDTLADCGFRKISTRMIFLAILLGVVLYFINSFVADAFYSIISLFGYEQLPTSSTTTQTLNYQFLLKEFILSCILPGFCEEFLHRGVMLCANKKYSNTKTCLIISSLLFGLTHLNIRQFFYASILGLLMGLVTLASNSIFPAMIIHFMNNFLSNYFFYGNRLNWPFVKYIEFVESLFMKNIFVYILSSVIAVALLVMLYLYLLRLVLKERAQNEVRIVVKELQMEKLSLIQAQIRFNEINTLIKQPVLQKQKTKHSLLENLFLIASFVLGILITISSFIWGVI